MRQGRFHDLRRHRLRRLYRLPPQRAIASTRATGPRARRLDSLLPAARQGTANLAAAFSQRVSVPSNSTSAPTRLDDVLDGADLIYHLAAMPGLPESWTEFDLYSAATSPPLSASSRPPPSAAPAIRRSSTPPTSSVYGRYGSGDETLPARPISPYGVTNWRRKISPGLPEDSLTCR